MANAYYANYRAGHSGLLDRYSAEPTHLAREVPRCPKCKKEMAFGLQLYCHPERLAIPESLCLHFYECIDHYYYHEVVVLPVNSIENGGEEIVVHPKAPIREVEWIKRVDPDPSDFGVDEIEEIAIDPDKEYLFEDKLGGFFPWVDEGGTLARDLGCIGQLRWFRNETTFYLFCDANGNV